ncbi:MAG: MFS transporter [Capsulimonadaceae bacterium]
MIKNELDKRGLRAGLTAALMSVAAIYLGSDRLAYFDRLLAAYAAACVLATFGIVYRYAVWLQRPPTGLYWRRGWQLFLRPTRLAANVANAVRMALQTGIEQRFIARRNRLRWGAHVLISWGCLAAAAVTLPLVFGWVRFEANPSSPMVYRTVVLGLRVGSFVPHSTLGWCIFHLLDFCALAVIAGMVLTLRRRCCDPGAKSVQHFSDDLVPLILLLCISSTGLALTGSALSGHGKGYPVLAALHAVSVIGTLLYLPFGKFFHIFQRPANIGIWFYKREGDAGAQAACTRCGVSFASRMHIDDLVRLLDELGVDQRFADGTHYQQVCPSCRRQLIATRHLDAFQKPGLI